MARLLPLAAAAAAAVFGIRFARREWRRINGELNRVRGTDSEIRGKDRKPIATLRRDEKTGEWRPSH